MALRLLAVGLGGALGAISRYLVTAWVHRLLPAGFPYGTLTVNVVGSLVVGFASGVFAERVIGRDHVWQLFVVVGVCGGFTTFSAFSAETYKLAEQGAVTTAAVNAALQVAGSLTAVFAGFWLSRQL